MEVENKGGSVFRFFRLLLRDLKEIGFTFSEGDWKTKISFLIMGFGQLLRGQIVRGISMLALEGGILYYLASFGWNYLKNILTLGTVETHKENRRTVYGDNSFLILLYGLLTIVIICALIFLWRVNIRQNRETLDPFLIKTSTRRFLLCRFSESSFLLFCRSSS